MQISHSSSNPHQQGFAELERGVSESHQGVGRAGRDALRLAMLAGDGLLEIRARKLIKHGQWSELCCRTCGSARTAQIYVKLAKARAILEENPQTSAGFSIDAALRFLRQRDGTLRAPTKKKAPALSPRAWAAASSDERRRFLEAIGLLPLLAAIPPKWRVEIERRARRQGAAAVSKVAETVTMALRTVLSLQAGAPRDEIAPGVVNGINAINNCLAREGLELHDLEILVVDGKTDRRAA